MARVKDVGVDMTLIPPDSPMKVGGAHLNFELTN